GGPAAFCFLRGRCPTRPPVVWPGAAAAPPFVSPPFLGAGGHRRGRLGGGLGRLCCPRLERLTAAAVDGELGLDTLLGEQALALRRLADDGGIVGLGRQSDADHLLRLRRGAAERSKRYGDKQRYSPSRARLQHEVHPSLFLPGCKA